MESQTYGVHEVTDLRELMNFKVSCLVQSKERVNMVENPELKSMVEESIEEGSTCVIKMQDLLRTASTKLNQ